MPEVVLTGAAGRIEGRYSQGKTETAPVALILHPHPKAGGQMNNPVAVQLYHLFMKRGFSVLRFNFRGVGRSQGEFDGGIGELADAATALDWLQATNPAASQCWVAGYSVRRLGGHAAADAPPRDRRLHLGVAARPTCLRLLASWPPARPPA
jgi:alpha/beta superfamily hydrolase